MQNPADQGITLAEHLERRGKSDGVEGPPGMGADWPGFERVLGRAAPGANLRVRGLSFGFHDSFGRLRRLSFLFLDAHPFGALGAVGKRRPRRLGPAATLAYMLERCRVPLGPRLSDAGEEELEVRITENRPRQA
jgi:hypothetical protein